MTLPTSAQGVPIVTFACGGSRCAVRLQDVERVVRMVALTPLPGAPAVVVGTVNVHGEVLPVADLGMRLGRGARDFGPSAHLLLTRTPQRRLVLAADEVRGVSTVAASAITSARKLSVAGPLVGGVALPDGVVYVYDLEAFLSGDESERLDAALKTGA